MRHPALSNVRRFMLCLVLLPDAAPLRAAPGELMSAYGRGGIAVEAAPVGTRPAYAAILDRDPGPAVIVAPDGSVLIARHLDGRCVLERLGLDGLSGLLPLGAGVDCSDRLRPEVAVGPAGEILFVYSPDGESLAVQRRRADGTPEIGFGAAGIVTLRPAPGGVFGRCFAMVLADGDVLIAVNGASTSAQSYYSTLLLVRLRPDGRPANWGTGGVVVLNGFEWGPLDTEGFGMTGPAVDGATLYGSGRFGFYRQSFGTAGSFYPYFPPEVSVDSDSPILSEFNEGTLAALFTYDGFLGYDGPAARFQALPATALQRLRPPSALMGSGSRLTPLRFRPLSGGGLLLAALHDETVAGAAQGRLVLLRFQADGAADPTFGRDGAVALDLALGGPPFAFPRTLTAPTLVGSDRVMLAGWANGRLGAVSVQRSDAGPSAGTIGLLARDGRFLTETEPLDGTLRFRVARQGGRRGAVSVAYRTSSPPVLAAVHAPTAGRLDWADGDDGVRDIPLTLRARQGAGGNETGTIELRLEDVAGGATLGSAVQQLAIVDVSSGTLAFERGSASVQSEAGTLRVGVTRSAGTRGAIVAIVAVPLPGSAGRVEVRWADGEPGTKTLDLPFDPGWNRFTARLETPPGTRPGALAELEVTIARAPTTMPTTTPPPPTVLVTSSGGSGGGGALPTTMILGLGVMLGALRYRRRSGTVRCEHHAVPPSGHRRVQPLQRTNPPPESRMLPVRLATAASLLMFLTMTAPLRAQSPRAAAVDAVSLARDAIWAKEQRIYQGRAEAGLTYYFENTSDRYVGWPPGLPKPSNLDALRKSSAGFSRKNSEKLAMSFTDFTLQDSTAVIYYQTHRTVMPDGTAVDERFDVIHVWVREGADWKLIGAMARLRT